MKILYKFFLLPVLITSCLISTAQQKSREEIIKETHLKPYDFYRLGVEFIKQGNLKEAIQEFDKEIAVRERNKDAYYNRGVAKFGMKDTAAACLDWGMGAYYFDTEVLELLDRMCDSMVILGEDTLKTPFFKSIQKSPNIIQKNGPNSTGEILPEFPGGEEAMLRFIASNIKYPTPARENNISGRVYVRFYINSNGKVCKPYIVRGIGGGCDEESLRVVQIMPDWKPGAQNGKPISVAFNLPIGFNLR